MAVVIDEVQVETTDRPALTAEPAAAPPRRPKLDAAEIERTLRQREHRLARLWAD